MSQKSTVGVYPKGIDIQLTKNFSSSELDCKCQYASCNKTLIDSEHIAKLQKLRDMIGPIKITSGFRCKRHNKNVGGVPTSQHVKGTATDIQHKRLPYQVIADWARKMFCGGIGIYDTFVHIDSRGAARNWDNRSKDAE